MTKKQFFCNEVNIALSKMAFVSGHKLTNIHTSSNGKTMCKLDGKKMTCKDARIFLLSKYDFVNSQNNLVK